MKPITTYDALEELGRVRLSKNFFMRDFLHSEIAAWYGLRNVPDDPDRAIVNGRMLCEQLLEPLQATFGRIHIRSGYRSPEVNALGNRNQHNCASNEKNHGRHIWDHPDVRGHNGAMACIVVPWLVDYMQKGGSWTGMAWWIHDHLPYGSLYFFTKLGAFNIGWHEQPERRIDSYVLPKGCLTAPGMANHGGKHADQYLGFPAFNGKVRVVAGPSSPTSLEGSVTSPQRLAPAPVRVQPSSPVARPEVAKIAPAQAKTVVPVTNGGKIHYRAVHTKTQWRKVNHHKTLESALYGINGAVGLFARKVRIDYTSYGEPLYVVVWQEGAKTGYVLKAAPAAPRGVCEVQVSVRDLLIFETAGSASQSQLEKYFR